MKKAAKKIAANTRGAVKKAVLKDLATGPKSASVKGGKAIRAATYSCGT